MSNAPSIRRAAILGVNGFVGRLLARSLIESGRSVAGLDLHDASFSSELEIDYLRCDAVAPGPQGREAIAAADAVFICLPEEVAMAALPALVQNVDNGALIVDTLSVKQGVVAMVDSLRPAQDYLSINLMFSPKLGFAGQNVAVVTVKDGPRAAEFIELLAAWKATAVQVGAQQHDRLTALIQVVTHAALLSIGQVLCDWDYDVGTAVAMATPPHRICLALLARISDAAPEVYWDIQQSNAFARDARRDLAAKLAELSSVVETGREEKFREIMAGIGEMLAPLKKELLDSAASISAASTLSSPRGCSSAQT